MLQLHGTAKRFGAASVLAGIDLLLADGTPMEVFARPANV